VQGLQQTIASGTYWRPSSGGVRMAESAAEIQRDCDVPEAICLGICT
jgi:hypothetical protein